MTGTALPGLATPDLVETMDAAKGTGTIYDLGAGGVFDGTLSTEQGHDWVAVDLVAGESYVFSVWGRNGASAGLDDPELTLRGAGGQILDSNDDASEDNYFSLIPFTAQSSGMYYLEVSGVGGAMGDYRLQAAGDLYTPEQVAGYMTDFEWGYAAPLRFDAKPGDTLTVDLTGLTAEGRQMADWALEAWSGVTGITFQKVADADAHIVFDDEEPGAFAGPAYFYPDTGINERSTVNVSTQWLADYGTTIDSYAFESYLHEIGHALGLGHTGDYNGSPVFGEDSVFINDSTQMSVMSYFSPDENPEVAGDEVLMVTPMLADLVAVQYLYGTPQAQEGDTVWGENATVDGYLGEVMAGLFDGATVDELSGDADLGFTVFDTGGRDTLAFGGVAADQVIDLREGRFSNVAGLSGNLAIALGTVIENALAGSGHDRIVGNAADNRLEGGAGDDTVLGGAGTDTLVLTGLSRADATATGSVSALTLSSELGTDVCEGVELFAFADGTVTAEDLLSLAAPEPNTGDTDGGAGGKALSGGAGNDRLEGTEADDVLEGGGGADGLLGGLGNDTLRGGDGDDNLAASDGNDVVEGGAGNDLMGGGLGDDHMNGGLGDDFMGGGRGNDTVLGGDGRDVVNAGAGADELSGGEGADTMGASFGDDIVDGGAGDDSMGGGAGKDVLTGGAGADSIGAGEGDDVIHGEGGDDFLAGGGRHDEIHGGAGADTINGGAGDDTMTGGADGDQFVFNELVDGETDVILGFKDGLDGFRLTGVQNAPGSGLSGYVDALAITDTTVEGEAGVSMSYNGHTILVQGVGAADLTVDDFTFLL